MFEKYDHNKTYLVACSGGPDSMALLDMLYNDSFKLVVCNVNYKTRKESDLEEKLVKDYCLSRNIKCYVSIFDESYKGKSFEDVARKFRYRFFAKIYNQEQCSGLFVGHHKDDLLETYLLKKQRKVINESFLLQEENIIEKMIVYRPLIKDYYKKDLLDYCIKCNIPYSIDYTNYLDIHPRNVIRKQLLVEDKEKIYQQALNDEKELINTKKQVLDYLSFYPIYDIQTLENKNDMWLMIFLYEKCRPNLTKKVNKSLLLKLKSFINSKKANLEYEIYKGFYMLKKYQQISFEYLKKDSEYQYVLDKFKLLKTPYFKIKETGLKMEGVYVSNDDYPITIRNYRDGDKIQLKEGYKKINRLFIDKKVPVKDRNQLPIIVNKNNKIIFVYKLYRKYGLKEIKNNLFLEK